MAEGRMLKKRISESKKLAMCSSDSSRLLYTWLIAWLDIADRFSGDPEIIKGHIFPKIKSWTNRKIVKCLEELHAIGLIVYYEVEGEMYLQFIQTLQKKYPDREAASIIPKPPKEAFKSCGRMSTHAKIKLNQSKIKESKVTKLTKTEILKLYEKYKINEFKTIEEFFQFMFDEFWNVWPADGRLNKAAAKEKYFARLWEGLLPEIIRGTNGYISFLEFQQNEKNFEQRAMYPSTFLEPKKARWKEYMEFKKPKKL